MTRAPRSVGGVVVPALVLVGVVGMGAATWVTIPHAGRPGDTAPSSRPLSAKAKRNLDVAATDSLLRRVHLTPEALAAAGLSAADADTVITAMLLQVETGELADQVRAATRAYNQAVQAAGKSRPTPGQELPSSAARAATLAQTRAERDGLLDTAWTLSTAALSAEQRPGWR